MGGESRAPGARPAEPEVTPACASDCQARSGVRGAAFYPVTQLLRTANQGPVKSTLAWGSEGLINGQRK